MDDARGQEQKHQQHPSIVTPLPSSEVHPTFASTPAAGSSSPSVDVVLPSPSPPLPVETPPLRAGSQCPSLAAIASNTARDCVIGVGIGDGSWPSSAGGAGGRASAQEQQRLPPEAALRDRHRSSCGVGGVDIVESGFGSGVGVGGLGGGRGSDSGHCTPTNNGSRSGRREGAGLAEGTPVDDDDDEGEQDEQEVDGEFIDLTASDVVLAQDQRQEAAISLLYDVGD